MVGFGYSELLEELGARIAAGAAPTDPEIGELFVHLRQAHQEVAVSPNETTKRANTARQESAVHPADAIINYALQSCELQSDAVALVASCAYRLAFLTADAASRPNSHLPEAAVFERAARLLNKLGEQFIVWSRQFELMPRDFLVIFRNRIKRFADRDRRALAQKLPYLLGSPGSEPPPENGEQGDPDPRPKTTIEDADLSRLKPEPSRGFRAEPIPNCTRCGAALRLLNGEYGNFMGCSRYNQCKSGGKPLYLGVTCPEPGCTGHLIEKRIPDPMEGSKVIVSCSNFKFKGCGFGAFYTPERIPCHRCGLPFRLTSGRARFCIDPNCVPSDLEGVDTLLELAFRSCGSRARAACSLTVASGVAVGRLGVDPEIAIADFVTGWNDGVARRERPQASPSQNES